MSGLTSTQWLLLGLIALMTVAACFAWAGRFIDKYLDERSADGQHPKADMAAIERQTRAVQRMVPSAPQRAAMTARNNTQRIQAHAVRTALNDFAKGIATPNPHAEGTLGNKQWHSHYHRVMHDQRQASAAVQATV